MGKPSKIYQTMLLGILSVLFLLPLIVTFTNSFMGEIEIALNYSGKLSLFDLAEGISSAFIKLKLIPAEATLKQYKSVLISDPTFLVLLSNSIKLTVPVVIGNIIVSALASYGFILWKFKYKEIIFYIYITIMLMPMQAVLVPNFIAAGKLGIQESYLAIILPGVFSPFGTFLLRQNMKSIPKSYLESAEIDGASHMSVFINIVLPQMKSGIAALAMLTFIEYWNIVEQAIIFIKDYTKEPLSVYLSRIAEGRISIIFAASCVYMAIPLWTLVFGREDLERGIEMSGVK